MDCAPYQARPKALEFKKPKFRNAGNEVKQASVADWAVSTVLAPKKDVSIRFCADYRKANSVRVHDSYPIPQMDEGIDSLGDALAYSTLDASRSYW